jgi:hypothetical protein
MNLSMDDIIQIPRRVIEEDPLWEQDLTTEVNLLRWRKKGTSLFATCDASSMTCDLYDYSTVLPSISNFPQQREKNQQYVDNISKPGFPPDIKKYLSSRYLNPYYDTPDLQSSKLMKMKGRPGILDMP